LRLHIYLKEASRLWLVIGTVMTLISTFQGFELSLTYLLAAIILWGLMVGLPFSILMEVGRWLEKRSQNLPQPSERKSLEDEDLKKEGAQDIRGD